MRLTRWPEMVARTSIDPVKGNNMGGTGKKTDTKTGPTEKVSEQQSGKDGGKAKKPPPAPVEDDFEDGDFATPKRDRYGDDDQPL